MDLQNRVEFEKVIIDISEKRFNEFYSFIKQIVIIDTTILGVIISLKQDKITDLFEFYSFISVIGMLSLSILIGVILLFGKLRAYDLQRQAVQIRLNKLLSGEKINSTTIYIPTEKIFIWLEITFYVVFVISILCIFLYSVIAFS